MNKKDAAKKAYRTGIEFASQKIAHLSQISDSPPTPSAVKQIIEAIQEIDVSGNAVGEELYNIAKRSHSHPNIETTTRLIRESIKDNAELVCLQIILGDRQDRRLITKKAISHMKAGKHGQAAAE